MLTTSVPQRFPSQLVTYLWIFFKKIISTFNYYLFIYLFMAVLGLRFCARAPSSCGKRGPLFIAVRGPLTIAASRCRAQAPDVQAQQLWLTGLVAPRHVGFSQTRARTRVPCIGRQILNHCATREAHLWILTKTALKYLGVLVTLIRLSGLFCSLTLPAERPSPRSPGTS